LQALIANPHAVIWVLNTDREKTLGTDYCVRAAVWGTLLARQIGMSKDDLDTVFRGTLLADIGMQMLPERLVNKTGHFRKKEYLAYRKHIQFGLQIIAEIPNLDERIASIVRNHHERHDGLGFPRGLRGEQIPVLARITCLAYCFERLINSNNPARRVSPARAMSRIYKQRLLKFPEQLVGEFSAAMGMYPVGTLVTLNSKEVALVLEQSDKGKMSPKIAVLSDPRGNKLEQPQIVDLANKDSAERVRSITGPTDMRNTAVDPRDYTFAFAGKRILGFRL
ncbi:MAG: HD domain-containing phosphohydrolase, partial [Gammaproteobacteria bacterium]